MVYLILQTGRELSLVIKWGGGKLWFFVPLDPRRLFDCRGGKRVFFFFFFLPMSATSYLGPRECRQMLTKTS